MSRVFFLNWLLILFSFVFTMLLIYKDGFKDGLAAQPPDAEYHYWQGYMDAKSWCETGIVFPTE